ncbi:MAG: peptidase S41, partial [Bacteroidales bacterium]|nr:peptidase S41 [Bacteroidales bacterium]
MLNYLDATYVDTINREQLTEEAINAMLQYLDPHSVYVNAQENKMMMESLDGEFEGVGIQYSIMNDTVMVIATISGGPSEKVGI